MADREKRERKLIALMVSDLSDDELRGTLAARLDLPRSVDEEKLDQTLLHVEEPEEISGHDFTRAPDMSHEPRPEEREG